MPTTDTKNDDLETEDYDFVDFTAEWFDGFTGAEAIEEFSRSMACVAHQTPDSGQFISAVVERTKELLKAVLEAESQKAVKH